ncbi:MAG: AI-2E family transporter, partial [Clostridia bacterium]|nr:AI-2E family transporter [Clostridia bacterium]
AEITHTNKRVVRLIVTILATLLIISGFVLLLWYIVNKCWQFLSGIDVNSPAFQSFKDMLTGGFLSDFLHLGELSEYIGGVFENMISSLLERLGSTVSDIALKLPGVFVSLLVTVIASAYFALDLDRINAGVKKVIPARITRFLSSVKRGFMTVGVKYIRSYLIIMGITFITLLVGFLIIGVKNAFIIALLTAVLDILPILGIGTVMLPWSVICFILGDIRLGVGLIIIFVLLSVLREFLEPKLVGKSLGLHPVLTLLLLYLGYTVFGIVGMIILPPLGALISVVLNKNNSTAVK